jgi:signal transduction histidine kinase
VNSITISQFRITLWRENTCIFVPDQNLAKMHTLPIGFNAQTALGHQPSINDDLCLNVTTDEMDNCTSWATPEIMNNQPAHFTTVLAHEIRNPLTNINLSVELIEAEVKNDDLKLYIDIIKRSSVRINGLINELLRYQQTDEVPADKHSTHQLLDEILETAKDRIALKNITVKKEYAVQECKIVLNRPKMKMALTNIIINAIEAMETDKGQLSLVTKSMGDKYIVEIKDNGCGISKDNLQYIYKPFFTNKPGGLGFGLAIAYDILRSDLVGVSVRSKKGEGTRFVLMFDKNIPTPAPNGIEILKVVHSIT